jgi:hypothetical protein
VTENSNGQEELEFGDAMMRGVPKYDAFLPPSLETRCDQLERQAATYLEENPQFWQEFCHWTFRMIRRGYRTYSHKTIVAVLRYHADHEFGPDAEGFKINDHHSATFARIFMRTYPQHSGFFPIRDRPSKRDVPAEE